jgi:hypothetical protein
MRREAATIHLWGENKVKRIRGLRELSVLGASALVVLAGQPAMASGHHPPPVRTITGGLDGPYGLDIVSGHALVAEADSGEITSVDLKSGAKHVVIAGLPGPSGVAEHGGKIYVALGGGSEEGPPPPSKYPPAALLVANKNGEGVHVLAALSNPFSLTDSPWGLLVADGGANDVLRVDPRTGRISTYFVPPTAKTPDCLVAGAQANPGTVGCDPVPTGVAVQGKYVYVSTLGAEHPGASAVWKLDGRTGKVLRVWTGFTSLTGVAVTPGGTIYASEVLFGAPEGDPPPGFDPSKVGRLTRIDHGQVTHAAVTMPTGLRYVHGHLYATSWSIASFLGIQHAGQLVEVSPRAFH